MGKTSTFASVDMNRSFGLQAVVVLPVERSSGQLDRRQCLMVVGMDRMVPAGARTVAAVEPFDSQQDLILTMAAERC